jgi:hypothetical protein
MYYPILSLRPHATSSSCWQSYCEAVYYILKETTIMKKDKKQIDSELRVKSTAKIREEVIEELTMPDKSLALLLQAEIENNNDQIEEEEYSGDR